MYWIDTYISYKRYKLSIQAGEDLLGASGVRSHAGAPEWRARNRPAEHQGRKLQELRMSHGSVVILSSVIIGAVFVVPCDIGWR